MPGGAPSPSPAGMRSSHSSHSSDGNASTPALLLLRATRVDTSILVPISMYLHFLYLLFMSATSCLHIRHVLRIRALAVPSSGAGRSGCSSVKTGQVLVLSQILLTTLNEMSYLSFFPSGTRAAAVKPVPGSTYTPAQHGCSTHRPQLVQVYSYFAVPFLSYMLLNLAR